MTPEVQKRVDNLLAQAVDLIGYMSQFEVMGNTSLSKAGGHTHKIDSDNSETALDGSHSHSFVLPVTLRFTKEDGGQVEITAGTPLQTDVCGPHSHTLEGGAVVQGGQHRHVMPIREGLELFTETDGAHAHDDSGGDHDHAIKLGGQQINTRGDVVSKAVSLTIPQTSDIEAIAREVLSSPEKGPVLVWETTPPQGTLPTLKVPDPKFLLDRLMKGDPAGLLAIRRQLRRVGQPQLLVNEVGPLGLGKSLAWGVVSHSEPVQIANVSELTPELREGLDKHTWTEFNEEKNLFHIPLELVVVFDPPLELSRPPGGHRFGSVVDLGEDVIRSRQISIDDLLRDAARRDVHAFVNDPSTDMLRRATPGHLLELDQQLHRLFERAFAGKDVFQAEDVTRDGVVSAHEFVVREIERRRIQTVEEDALAAATRALAELSAKQREIVVLRELVTKQEPTTVQTLIFSKEVFQSVEEAVAWAKEHDFKFDKVDEKENTFRLRQRDPDDFVEGSYKTIDLTEGVQAVIGRLKEVADKAVWSRAFINDLPDSSFLYIEPGGRKDEEGKTVPRTLRHFPIRDENGKIDLPHLRNAIARIPQSKTPGLSAEDKRRLQEKARRLLEEEQAKAEKRDPSEDLPSEVEGAVNLQEDPAEAEEPLVEEFITHNVRLIKRFVPEQEEERFVFGVVLVPGEVDAQGETYDAPTVRKAAHSFMENGGFNKIMHKGEPVDGVIVVENTVSNQVERHNGEDFPEGTWFLGVRVRNDNIWKEIKAGSFTGFSMGGTAVRESLADDLPQAA